MIKSEILRWAGQVARIDESKSDFKISQENLQEDLGVNWRLLLEFITIHSCGHYITLNTETGSTRVL